jgi:hypothetical protein
MDRIPLLEDQLVEGQLEVATRHDLLTLNAVSLKLVDQPE